MSETLAFMTASQLPQGMQMWATFAIILVAIAGFANDRWPIELTCALVLTTLLVFFQLFPVTNFQGQNILNVTNLLMGFANPVLFAIMALLIIGQGLYQTGALEGPANMIARLGRKGPWLAFAVAFILAGAISAIMNNTPVVVIFIPIITAVARNMGMSASRALMPLSFICILGGMTTLIGSSANLIAATIAEQNKVSKIGFFDFTIPGLVLAGIGAIYVIFLLPRLINVQEKRTPELHSSEGKHFVAQIILGEDHPWIGTASKAGFFPNLKNMTVRSLIRDRMPVLPPFDDITLKQGDIIVLAATRKVLQDALKFTPASLQAREESETILETSDIDPNEKQPIRPKDLSIAEVVVAPASRLIGEPLDPEIIHAETGCDLAGIQRRSQMGRGALQNIRLEAGDVLLLTGEREDMKKLRANRNLLLLEWSQEDLPVTHHAFRALIIFIITIWLAASNMLPISIAAIGGAATMILTGCLNVRQAARAIDRRVYLLVGTAFALAVPLQATGGAHYIAQNVVNNLAGFGPHVLLSAFFLLTALLTNFLSNHATAALMAPIAVDAARELGVDPVPFIHALIFALNCSFATPIAYQTNLIVMGPGNYRFKDFVIGGLPLIMIIWLAFTLFAPFYYVL